MIKLHDFYIGNFPITQYFGMRPDVYSWIKDDQGQPIKGHNGVDIGVPNNTILLNPFPANHEVVVSKVGNDLNGYGNYVRIWDKTQDCVVLYAHCAVIKVTEGDLLYFQQEVARSDNTGWSSGAHVHIGCYEVDGVGNKISSMNGYNGYINIFDKTQFELLILNPSKPGEKPKGELEIKIPASVHTQLVTNSDNYKRVIAYIGILKDVDETSSDDVISVLRQTMEDLKGALDAKTSCESRVRELEEEAKSAIIVQENIATQEKILEDKKQEVKSLLDKVKTFFTQLRW